MATHKKHTGDASFYFITFTCYKWLPLIKESNVYDFFKISFKKMAERGAKVCGFVIMPNHVHILVYKTEVDTNINVIIATAKRFLAKKIISILIKLENINLLNQLSNALTNKEVSRNYKHRVFIRSFDAKEVCGTDEIVKTLDYIHHNPVSGTWSLCENFTDYPYSSAKFYELGVQSDYPIYHFEEV